ncbi:MAG: acetyl-CoA carboxylase biotin carboxyl carrier protein [Planctomyces sp.]|jgi:acetyl-CoA carboxylase biotin carboxyl carrier protein
MAKPVETEPKRKAFDLDDFRKLLQLMEKYGVSEVSLSNEDESWKVRRGPRQVAYAPTMPEFAPVAAAPAAPAVAAPAAPAAAAPAAAPVAAPAGILITAPTVGTFYAAPSPEDPPFVSVGTVVKPDTVVCIIEAMKVFNQIQGEKAGRIVEILVQSGEAVGFGQPLFRLEPA